MAAAPLASPVVFDRPIVIAHRGASGYLPEHTLEAYRLAIAQGADFIEPDLVPTRDGVLIARHENELSKSTDVAAHPEFAARNTTKRVDGVAVTGWFSEDFTLAEIKRLRAREAKPTVRPHNTRFDDAFEIPTLAEVIALVQRDSARTGRPIGLYPETKHPTYFLHEGHHLDGALIAADPSRLLIDGLQSSGFTDPARVFIQSFEIANLIALKREIMPAAGLDFPLVQLFGDIARNYPAAQSNFSAPYDVGFHARRGDDLGAIYGALDAAVPGGLSADTHYGDLLGAAVLKQMRRQYATGIGPWIASLLQATPLATPIDGDGDGRPGIVAQIAAAPHPFLRRALDASLTVHPYTLRVEESFLFLDADGRPQSVQQLGRLLLELGVHGWFIDQPDLGVGIRDAFMAE